MGEEIGPIQSKITPQEKRLRKIRRNLYIFVLQTDIVLQVVCWQEEEDMWECLQQVEL
jgi:hypothetical protein